MTQEEHSNKKQVAVLAEDFPLTKIHTLAGVGFGVTEATRLKQQDTSVGDKVQAELSIYLPATPNRSTLHPELQFGRRLDDALKVPPSGKQLHTDDLSLVSLWGYATSPYYRNLLVEAKEEGGRDLADRRYRCLDRLVFASDTWAEAEEQAMSYGQWFMDIIVDAVNMRKIAKAAAEDHVHDGQSLCLDVITEDMTEQLDDFAALVNVLELFGRRSRLKFDLAATEELEGLSSCSNPPPGKSGMWLKDIHDLEPDEALDVLSEMTNILLAGDCHADRVVSGAELLERLCNVTEAGGCSSCDCKDKKPQDKLFIVVTDVCTSATSNESPCGDVLHTYAKDKASAEHNAYTDEAYECEGPFLIFTEDEAKNLICMLSSSMDSEVLKTFDAMGPTRTEKD